MRLHGRKSRFLDSMVAVSYYHIGSNSGLQIDFARGGVSV